MTFSAFNHTKESNLGGVLNQDFKGQFLFKKVSKILKDFVGFNDFHDFKRLSGFSIWISMDLHHKILKDL